MSTASTGNDIARPRRMFDLSEPERSAQAAAKGAEEATRRAATAADTAQRDGARGTKTEQSAARPDSSMVIAEASRDAARYAVDAAHDAARAAAAAARAANTVSGDAAAVVQAETARARAAAERAWEAADEAADRPARMLPAAAVIPTSSSGIFQNLRRSMQAEGSFSRGTTLLEDHKYREARDQFAEAVALYPEHDQARALLGWSEYFLGDFRDATITFKTALRRQPTWEGLYNGLGWSRLRLGRYQMAAAAFKSALDRNPDYVDALNGLGSAQFERGNYEAALPSLEKALNGSRRALSAEPPEVTILRGKIAWSLYYLERHREALAMFIRASLASPDSYQYQVGMGWCYLKLGQRNDARAAFQRALKLGPTDEAAREGLRRAGI
ncbi:MAG TPA: tetratricopeptide repeat protein [bacterium]|nr:tetratricopeptide repeat protein [bacterium]